MTDLPDEPTRPIDAAPEPSRIGRYELLERIGKGGMGVVYRARDTMLGRMVAVKMLVSDVEVSAESRERFFREARAAGQLGHRNIITIYDFGEENGHAFIVMELLQGENLTNLLAREPNLPLEQRLDIMMRVCEGLAFAHSRAIVHRDIKPANLFVTSDGQVKILDFGVARIASSNLTKSGLIVGTPEYMSPEQVRGRTVDQRSDIFSVGAVFYQLLSGRKPFAARSLPQVMQKVVSEDPAPLGEAEASPDLAAIITRALEKDPERRYQQLQEMLGALARFVQTYERGTRELALKAYDRYREVERMLADRVALAEALELPRDAGGVAVAPLLQDLPLFQEIGGDVLRVVPFRRGRAMEILRLLEEQHETLVTSNATWRGAVAALDAAAGHARAGEFTAALEALATARGAVPDAPRIARLIEQVRVESSAAQNRDAVQPLIARASQALAAGDLDAAGHAVADIQKVDPTSADATRLREEIDRRRAVVAARATQARRVAEALAAARRSFARGDRRDAIKLLQDLVAEAGSVPEVDAEIARMTAEDRRLAAEERRRADAAAKAAKAAAAFQAGDATGALRLAEEALQLDADNEQAFGLRADATARKEVREVARQRATKVAALVARGQALLDKGSLWRAERVAHEAVERDPESAAAAALLAAVMRGKLKAPGENKGRPEEPVTDADPTPVLRHPEPAGAPSVRVAAAADAARQPWRPSTAGMTVAAAIVLALGALAWWGSAHRSDAPAAGEASSPTSSLPAESTTRPAAPAAEGARSEPPPAETAGAGVVPAPASPAPASGAAAAAPDAASQRVPADPSAGTAPPGATPATPSAARGSGAAGSEAPSPTGASTASPRTPSAGPGIIPAGRKPGESLAAWRRRSKELTARYGEAKSAFDASDFTRAITLLSALLGDEPGYADVASLIATARASIRAEQRNRAEAAFQDGARREKADDLSGALASYRESQRLDSDFEPPRGAIATLVQRMKGLAQDVLRRARAQDAFGRTPEAIALYKRAIELLPEDDPQRAEVQQRLDTLQGRRK